ncbi:uncharacterized protein [Dysidea avara]
MIDVIMRKPEFSLLIRYYNLLYQSLIPNCKLTIKILKQHIKISSDVESFIVNEESSRIRCQRIINLLLVQLDTTRDYKHFCYLFNMISVTDLTNKLRTGFDHNHNYNRSSRVNQSDYAVDNIIIRCVDDGPSDDRADNYSISSHHQVIGRRRCRTAVTTATSITNTITNHPVEKKVSHPVNQLSFLFKSSERTMLDHYFPLLCNCLLDNYQFTLIKLKRLPQLSNDDHQQLGTMISSSCEAQLVNEKIVTFLIVKLCYNGSSDSLVGLCDVMDNLVQSDQSTGCVQQLRCALTEGIPSSKVIPTTSSLQGSSVITVKKSHSVTCTQHDTSATTAVVSIASMSYEIATSWPVNNRSITGAGGHTVTTVCLPQPYAVGVQDPRTPQKITVNKDFSQLRTHYQSILRLMPDNYEQSVGKLQNYISDDQICMILSSGDYTTANKIILDCLIERMSCREELLDLCDQLETISTSQQLNMLISKIRSEFVQCFQFTGASASPTDIQSSSVVQQQYSPLSNVSSRMELQERMKHNHKRLEKGIKSPLPPPLPPNNVCHQQLLNDMVKKLCESSIDSNSYGTSVTVTGAGGFGKTSIVTALCHHPVVKEQFKDGVVFIELGPQATDPSMKLSQLYHLLTGQYLKQGDINHSEREVNQLTSLYCRNLLVIIDDVWHVEDAEPIVKAFSNCKIVLTTRMNDMEQYIPTKQVVSVGAMERSEAISLLTCGVIDISQLSQVEVNLLDELAQDVHLWPLLLSLVRGQLLHALKHHKLCNHKAIKQMQDKSHYKGLTAFDKNNIEGSRKYAARVCLDVTLELLSQTLSDKLKSLILWTGIGTSLQTAVLHILWSVTVHEAREIADELWAYGVVKFTEITNPLLDRIQHVEVHSIISQLIIENMDSTELCSLASLTGEAVLSKAHHVIMSCITGDTETVTEPPKYLKCKMIEIEYYILPYCVQYTTMLTIHDPHHIMCVLQWFCMAMMASSYIEFFFPTLNAETNSLINNCQKAIKNAHKLSRTLTQSVQRCLSEGRYCSIPQTVQQYINKYPTGSIALQAITMIKKVIPYCGGQLLDFIVNLIKQLQTLTPEYHRIPLMVLPRVRLLTNELQQIVSSLLAGSPDMEKVYNDYISGKIDEEYSLVNNNYVMKLSKISSNS